MMNPANRLLHIKFIKEELVMHYGDYTKYVIKRDGSKV